MNGDRTAATIAMIAGCAVGALVAVTTARMSAIAAAVAGAVASLVLQGTKVALATHAFAVGVGDLKIAALAGAAAAAGAVAGGRWRGQPMLLTAASLVSLGVAVSTWSLALLVWELAHPLPHHLHVTVPAVLLGAPLLGGVACALVIPGCNAGHVAMSWLAIIVSMTFSV